jgi:hypothetical protein
MNSNITSNEAEAGHELALSIMKKAAEVLRPPPDERRAELREYTLLCKSATPCPVCGVPELPCGHKLRPPEGDRDKLHTYYLYFYPERLPRHLGGVADDDGQITEFRKRDDEEKRARFREQRAARRLAATPPAAT